MDETEIKVRALELALQHWIGASVDDDTVVDTAKMFEAYLKGE